MVQAVVVRKERVRRDPREDRARMEEEDALGNLIEAARLRGELGNRARARELVTLAELLVGVTAKSA